MLKVVKDIAIKITNIIFVIIMLWLFVTSLFLHCEMDIDSSSQMRNLENHTFVIYAFCSLVGGLIVIFIWKILDRKIKSFSCYNRIASITVIVGSLCVTVIGILWCLFYDGIPKNDQIKVFIEAQKIAGYSTEAFNLEYVEYFPRQKGQILCMALVLKVLGDSVYSWRILNLAGAFFLLLGMGECIMRVLERDMINIVVTLLYVSFFPIVVYTAFHYGTLMAVTFSVWACYGVFSFVEEKKWRYVILASICFSIGMQMHQSVAIAIVAAILYLLLNIKREKVYCLSMILSILVSVFVINSATDIVYGKMTDYDFNNDKAFSVMEYLYMGLTADTEAGGPGSVDGSFAKFRQLYPDDVEMRKKAALDAVKLVVSEYLSGTRDGIFFVEKIQYQWLDPTFGARKTIIPNYTENGEPEHTELFYNFYYGMIRRIIFVLLNIFMIMVYFFSLVAGIGTLCKKRTADIHFFIQIYFLGGFVFQILWESLSRYCFPYYLWLILEAVYGVSVLADKIDLKRLKEKNGKYLLEKNTT